MNVKDLIMKLAEYGSYFIPEFNIEIKDNAATLSINLKPSQNAHNIECHAITIPQSQIKVIKVSNSTPLKTKKEE